MTAYGIINLLLTGASEHGAFDWRFVMEHTVNLIILLGVLVYFLKTPVKNFLLERRGTIGHEIDVAQKTISEAKSKYEEYAKKLQAIETEINSLKMSLRMQGEAERGEILKQAEAISQNVRKEAKEIIELQTERARRDIQTEVVNLALASAEDVIRRNMGDSDKERYVQEFTKNIEEEKWHQSQH
jgi:F-type H+-transporting ATPase subunit b